MNLKNLFRLTAVLGMIIGVTWVVAPSAMTGSMGINLDPYSAYYLQILGTINISLAVLFFLVSGMAHSPARQAVVTFYIVQQALSLIVTLMATLGGVLPAGAGWTTIAFNVVFILAFGYFRFIRPEASATPGLQS
jgi:hypothetical protein